MAFHIDLYPPDNRRRDVDNSLKCLPDTFTHGGLYADDSLIYKTDCHQTGTNATGRDGLHKDRTMERRQNGGRQRYIVQQFVKNISDDTERLVCFMYMRNASDKEICKQLKISHERLEEIKLKLAIDMKNAGIRIKEG